MALALGFGTVQPAIAAPAERLTGHWGAVARKDGGSWGIRIDIPGEKPQGATVDLVDIAAYGVEFRAASAAQNGCHLETRRGRRRDLQRPAELRILRGQTPASNAMA